MAKHVKHQKRSGRDDDGQPDQLSATGVVALRDADVGRTRESRRLRRFIRLAAVLWALVLLCWWRALSMSSGDFLPMPDIDPIYLSTFLFFIVLIGLAVGQSVVSGKSPHVTYRPEQLKTTLADVVGIDGVKEDVIRSLNLFLAHRTFSQEMGGTPRRGLLFEGAPGTGKTHLARAMAKEAGVPFLFASATSFQSSFYGATGKKIRSYFKALRKAARAEGGAIGFIEEFDALGMARSGMSGMSGLHNQSRVLRTPFVSDSVGATVNELLVQMQSFDELTRSQRLTGWLADRVNAFLPLGRQIPRPAAESINILLIAATNRADSLDPALLRPGRFDRRMTFELPAKAGRRELVDYFLRTKSHSAELDDPERRDALAAVTQGYSPVMIEHLLDEALVAAVRGGRRQMTWADVEHARLVEEVGIGSPVDYTAHERVLIATHEAGHATLAWLTAPQRRLEILTIIKRRGALGMLAHGDREDVYTRSRAELRALVQISFGGQCAEEIFFGDVSTGPGGDLQYATSTVAEMLGAYGMTGSLVSYAAIQNSGFADTNIVGKVLADSEGRARVEEILQEIRAEALAMLHENQHVVTALRDALLERHELIGHEITQVIEAACRPAVIDLTEWELSTTVD